MAPFYLPTYILNYKEKEKRKRYKNGLTKNCKMNATRKKKNNERRKQFMTGSLHILNNLYILACRAVREIFCDGSNGT